MADENQSPRTDQAGAPAGAAGSDDEVLSVLDQRLDAALDRWAERVTQQAEAQDKREGGSGTPTFQERLRKLILG